MPAIPIVAYVAVDYAIGTYVAEAIGAEILGSTLLANAATGAITGAVSGGAVAAATGGDVGKGIEQGAIGGAVAAPVSKYVSGELAEAGASRDVARSVGRGTGTTAAGLATGRDLESSLKSGVISGGVDFLFGEPPAGASKEDKALLSAEKGFTTQAVNQLFAPTQTSRSAQTAGGGGFAPSDTSATTTGAGQTPGSQALAQALRVGDAGGPIFGGGGEDTQKKSGWNVESLRYMGQEG